MSRSLSARIRRAALAGAACATCVSVFALPARVDAQPSELAPKHLVPTVAQAKARPGGGGGGTKSNGINYNGGSLITSGPNAYVIWYGAWANSTSPSIIDAFLHNVGGSPYFNINTTYYDGSKVHVPNVVHWSGETNDNYSHGTTLSDADVQAVVAGAITAGLPKDTNGVYFVLTSSDVSESSGFLTQYCGWHTHGIISGSDIKYSFVGDASLNLSACAAQTASSPNNNVAADAMVSVIAHELEEATTDPDLNAWYDSRGYENADKCAWTFGTEYTTSNGSKANMNLGGADYLIQRNWVNASGGYCSLSY